MNARPRPEAETSDSFGFYAKPTSALPTPPKPTVDELLRQMVFKLQSLNGGGSTGTPGAPQPDGAMSALAGWRTKPGTGYRIPIMPPREKRSPLMHAEPLDPSPLRLGPDSDALTALAYIWHSGTLPKRPALGPERGADAPAVSPLGRAADGARGANRRAGATTDAGIFDLAENQPDPTRHGEASRTNRVVVRDTVSGRRHDVPDEAVFEFAGLADDLAAAPDDAPDELIEELGQAAASLLPGVGEVLSAKDAYDATRAALAALDDDRLGDAALQGGAAAIAIFGAIPGAGGAVRLTKSAAKALPVLYKLLRRSRETAAIAGRSASRQWFSRWSDNLLSGRTLPQGKMARVDALSDETMRFLREKGVAVGSASINIVDRRMMRMVRQLKTEKGIDVPKELLRDLLGAFRRREAVLWDKRKRNLVYVFDIPGDPKKGKSIVEIAVKRQVNRGDITVGQVGNYVTSGSRVQADALADTKMYDFIEGQAKQ